ncbi:hypothetical protein D3C81_1211350 [compost metagenome]
MQELVLRRYRMAIPLAIDIPAAHMLAQPGSLAYGNRAAMMDGLLGGFLAIQAVIVSRAAGVETADVIDLAVFYFA